MRARYAGESALENPLDWRQRTTIALQVAEGNLSMLNSRHTHWVVNGRLRFADKTVSHTLSLVRPMTHFFCLLVTLIRT